MRTLVAFVVMTSYLYGVEYPVDWSLDGISIIGVVDTDSDIFTMESFINEGPHTTYTPVVPVVFEAMTIEGESFDVADDFGVAGISDDWLFVGPLHALTTYEDGPTSGGGYHITFGGSEALTGLTVGQDERFFNLAVSPTSSATFVADTVSVPESTGLVLGGLALMALLGAVMMER